MIASIQAAEALKILTNDFKSLNNTLLEIDVWNTKFRQIDIGSLKESNNCPTCKTHNYEFLDAKDGTLTSVLCGKNAVQITYRNAGNTNLEQLAKRLGPTIDVNYNEFMLKFKVEEYEFTVFPDGRAIIIGANDTSAAKTLYSKYLGM